MTTLAWRLRGSTGKLVECCVELTRSRSHIITVVLGSETFLRETYPDTLSANTRSMQIRDKLVNSGRWTITSEACVEHR